MAARALVPFLAEGALADPPVEVAVWDGTGPLPAAAETVELYVLPYTFGAHVAQVMAQLPRLRYAQTLTTGYEHVVPYLPAGVSLSNARGVHDASTAELALALMLANQRGLVDYVRAQDRGQWAHDFRPSLADRTVLIVGYGSIGAAVEARLAGFECRVVRVARTAREGVVGIDRLPELLPGADVVVLTLPLTDATRGLVDAAFLARMPDGALLVNIARGPVVVTEALVAELRSGRLRAAVDVTDPEPLPPGHPLWSAPGLLISPHVGGNTTAFEPRAKALVAAQLGRFARGEPPDNVVVPAG